MLNTEECDEDKPNVAAQSLEGNEEFGGVEAEAREVALKLTRARILTLVPSQASNIVQFGSPMERVRNLKRYLEETDVFKEVVLPFNGRKYITFRIPIVDVPETLKPVNFTHGRLLYTPSIDYESGKTVVEGSEQFLNQ